MFNSLKMNVNNVTSLGTATMGEAKGLKLFGLFQHVFYLFPGVPYLLLTNTELIGNILTPVLTAWLSQIVTVHLGKDGQL